MTHACRKGLRARLVVPHGDVGEAQVQQVHRVCRVELCRLAEKAEGQGGRSPHAAANDPESVVAPTHVEHLAGVVVAQVVGLELVLGRQAGPVGRHVGDEPGADGLGPAERFCRGALGKRLGIVGAEFYGVGEFFDGRLVLARRRRFVHGGRPFGVVSRRRVRGRPGLAGDGQAGSPRQARGDQ